MASQNASHADAGRGHRFSETLSSQRGVRLRGRPVAGLEHSAFSPKPCFGAALIQLQIVARLNSLHRHDPDGFQRPMIDDRSRAGPAS